MKIKQEVITPHTHTGSGGEAEPIENHHQRHEVGGPDEIVDIDASHLTTGTIDIARLPDHAANHETGGGDALAHLAATVIDSGTLDGDRLPAISTTKKGAVPATGTPAGKFLRDDGDFEDVVTFNSDAPSTPYPWQLWYDNGIGASAVKVQLSLREHDFSPSYNPDVTFSKPDGATVKALSTTGALSHYFLFITLPKTAVHGRKVKITWEGNSTTTSAEQFGAYIVDRELSRSSGTDFPDGAWFPYTPLVTIAQKSATFASTTDTIIADLSAATSANITIMVWCQDGWTADSNWVQVTGIQVTDLSDKVLIEADIAGALSMESTGGVADYGVVGSGVYSSSLKMLEYWDAGSDSWLQIAEPYINAGLSTQYFRGDKTFQVLNGAAVANTPAGNIAAVTVQAAINELDTEKEPNVAAGSSGQYYHGDKTWKDVAASEVTFGPTSTLEATDVQGAIEELEDEKGPAPIIKTDTGDPVTGIEGQLCINTYDNNVKIFADGAWRSLATW
jgi:hypothetical protein